jgi:chromosome segregation ATPase
MSEQVLTQLLEQMQLLHKGQEQIHHKLEKMDGRLDNLDSRLDSLESRMDRVETRLDNLESRLERVETRLDSLESRMERVEAVVADIPLIRRAVLETNEDVKRFELHLQRHDTDIGNHEYSIKIIHYDQLKLHTEIEKLKNR